MGPRVSEFRLAYGSSVFPPYIWSFGRVFGDMATGVIPLERFGKGVVEVSDKVEQSAGSHTSPMM